MIVDLNATPDAVMNVQHGDIVVANGAECVVKEMFDGDIWLTTTASKLEAYQAACEGRPLSVGADLYPQYIQHVRVTGSTAAAMPRWVMLEAFKAGTTVIN